MICAAAVYIVFPLSFTSLLDLSAPYPPWNHCTLTQISSGPSSCFCKQKVTMLKRCASVASLCVSPHLMLYLSPELPTAFRTEVPTDCGPLTHKHYSVPSIKGQSLDAHMRIKRGTHYTHKSLTRGSTKQLILRLDLSFFHQPLVTGTPQIGEICPMASE